MNKQKKILMLGGSAQQVVAIERAKQMGYYTVLCDYLLDNPGQYVADKFYNESTTDVEAVYRIAKEEGVDGILAYASDPAALPAAIVAEKLELPTNSSESVSILGVKYIFREFLKDHGFACPKFFSFHPDMEKELLTLRMKELQFPIMIKPTDSSGSKGVTKIYSTDFLEEAIACAAAYSRNKVLIAEEFIERGYPNVIGGDIFIWDGEIVLYGEMSCVRDGNEKGLIPIGKQWPSGLNEVQTKNVHDELQRIVSELGIQFGEMNIELMLDEMNRVHFLELGPRAGGNMIPIHLSDVYGIDLVRANIAAAMGEYPQLELQPQKGYFMHYVLHSYEEGKFEGIYYSPEIKNNIYRQVIYKHKGDEVYFFDGAGKALGIIFLRFDTYNQMIDFCKRKDELVKINLL